MAIIGLNEARPGMVLACDVVDRTGRLLLSAHHPVTDRTLKIFSMWGVTELTVEDVDKPVDDQAPAAAMDPALLGPAQVTTDGHGTTFTLSPPRALEGTVPSRPAAAAGERTGGAEAVLVVDDDDRVRPLVCDGLRRYGYAVMEARNGADAVALFERQGERVDLLVTDVVMPGISGRELLRRLTSVQPGLRVVYISGSTDDVIGDHGILGAPFAYLQKPFTTAALAGKVREMLDADRVAVAASRAPAAQAAESRSFVGLSIRPQSTSLLSRTLSLMHSQVGRAWVRTTNGGDHR